MSDSVYETNEPKPKEDFPKEIQFSEVHLKEERFDDRPASAYEPETAKPISSPDEDIMLMHLAKERVMTKRRIIRNIAAYVISAPAAYLVLSGILWWNLIRTDFWLAAGFVLGIYTLWGILIARDVFKFLSGFVSKLYTRPDPVMMEYYKLKRTGHTKW